jgi:hypothetical protein
MLKDGRTKRNVERSAAFHGVVMRCPLAPKNPGEKDFYIAGLFEIAAEHHRAINSVLLLGLSSSALALMRPFIETSYRCIWLRTCASSSAVKKIMSGTRRRFPDLSPIISDLVRHSQIGEFKTEVPRLDLLHDLTHSGVAHLFKRFQRVQKWEESVEQDALFCIYHADYVLLLLGIFVIGAYGEPEHRDLIRDEYLKLRSSYEFPTVP